MHRIRYVKFLRSVAIWVVVVVLEEMNLGGLSFFFSYAVAVITQAITEYADAMIHFGLSFLFSSYAVAVTIQDSICVKRNNVCVGGA